MTTTNTNSHLKPPTFISIAIILAITSLLETHSFTTTTFLSPTITRHRHHSSSSQQLHAKKNKASFAQRKKQRGRKITRRPPSPSPSSSDSIRVDQWDTTKESGAAAATTTAATGPEDAAIQRKASELIETQRKSVNTLTHIRERIEILDYNVVSSTINNNNNNNEKKKKNGVFVVDGFLGSDLSRELYEEGLSLLQQGDKLDLLEIGSGEYGASVIGGDSYADSPRCVEFVVSLTKHLPPLWNDVMMNSSSSATEDGNDGSDVALLLDNTASAGRLLTFDRKARLAALKLFGGGGGDGEEEEEEEGAASAAARTPPLREFEVVKDNDEDTKILTVIYYFVPEEWDKSCGGGLTIASSGDGGEGELVEAKADRLIMFRSDECLHRREYWVGKDGLDYAGCLVVHLVKKIGGY